MLEREPLLNNIALTSRHLSTTSSNVLAALLPQACTIAGHGDSTRLAPNERGPQPALVSTHRTNTHQIDMLKWDGATLRQMQGSQQRPYALLESAPKKRPYPDVVFHKKPIFASLSGQ